ncbi:MAG: hypothetical protein ACXWNU_10505 [Candidatus Binataceae bacterium]
MQVQGLSGAERGQQSSPMVPGRTGSRAGLAKGIARAALLVALGCAGGAAWAAEAAKEAVQSEALPKSNSAFGPTIVGQKAAQFRADFEKLKANTMTRSQQLDAVRDQTVRNVNAYHTIVAAIRSRLQMGSTPGNPELLAQWAQAQTQLTQIDSDISTLNQLSTQVSGDAGTSAYLLENVRAAYGLSGALEEDHRQLRLLEDEVNQNAIVIDCALQNLNAEINRQQQYVSTERTSLVQLAADINTGQSFAAAPRRATTPRAVATVSATAVADRKPLVVIRFDKPDVAYEPALYQALSRALERRPDAVFDLVAVSPDGGNPSAARQDADAVLQSMTNMGLPAERVAMGAMGSSKAASPEVHIYVR